MAAWQHIDLARCRYVANEEGQLFRMRASCEDPTGSPMLKLPTRIGRERQ
jgi:hypothetical protein